MSSKPSEYYSICRLSSCMQLFSSSPCSFSITQSFLFLLSPFHPLFLFSLIFVFLFSVPFLSCVSLHPSSTSFFFKSPFHSLFNSTPIILWSRIPSNGKRKYPFFLQLTRFSFEPMWCWERLASPSGNSGKH